MIIILAAWLAASIPLAFLLAALTSARESQVPR